MSSPGSRRPGESLTSDHGFLAKEAGLYFAMNRSARADCRISLGQVMTARFFSGLPDLCPSLRRDKDTDGDLASSSRNRLQKKVSGYGGGIQGM